VIQSKQKISHTRTRNFLTILLWVLLASAVVPTACFLLLYLLVIILSGGGWPPTSSKTEVFTVLAIPSLFGVGAVGLAVLSIRLWNLPEWRAFSFVRALALDAFALVAALIVMLSLLAGI